MYKAPQRTSAFWSHVDLVATLCDLVGVEAPLTAGISQMPVLTNPASHVRNSVLFVFDDSFLLAAESPDFNPHIRALRTPQYTYAVYFSTANSSRPFEYELYDNLADPLQMNNLLFVKTASTIPIWVRLDRELQIAMREANAAPPNVVWQQPQPVA
jgi:arylsulfatase A-like enzyme